ncbi:UDP-glucose 4-epimerase GalE [Candidatus Poriferisodalis sp.]|uniref:UDP-glucose 4-epimerase GalE n=1 Tax=Candidatus Poriferisodalis sp. TaxID=3101277 RepID=UPI003B01C77D
MTVLVAGGAGYIGSHTVAALHAVGRGALVLDDFSNADPNVIDALRSLTSAGLVVVEGDAADPIMVESLFRTYDIDAVIHFAALKSVPESFVEPLRYFRNNLDTTLTLAETAADRAVSRFVFSSSAVVYGTSLQMPVTEEKGADPQSPYGMSKLMCEQMLTDVAAATGMQVAILRYFNPVGAHASGLIGEPTTKNGRQPPNLLGAVMGVALGEIGHLEVCGNDYDTRDGTAVRDFVHVMDLAEGHLAALDAGLGGASRVFNLGSGLGTTVLELVAAAEAVTGRPIPYEFAPRREGDIAVSWADCTRAAHELGWRAKRDLPQMLADQWRYVRRCVNGRADDRA